MLHSSSSASLDERKLAKLRRMNSAAQLEADKITSSLAAKFGSEVLRSAKKETLVRPTTVSASTLQMMPHHQTGRVNSLVPTNRFGQPLAQPQSVMKEHSAKSRKAGMRMKDYTDMKYKSLAQAFKAADEDRSSKLDQTELLKATMMWSLGLSHDEIDELIEKCDENGDGLIDYGEFSRGLGRLTEAHHGPSPFGQADSRVTNKRVVMGNQVIINDNLFHTREAGLHEKPMVIHEPMMGHVEGKATAKELERYVHTLSTKVSEKYAQMRKAFRAIDVDKSGYLTKDEMVDQIMHFALPIPLNHIGQIFDSIGDRDGDGVIDYDEFCKLMQVYEPTS